jgi:hypothetical protein
MRRPQFSIRTLLWLTLVAAAFFGGIAYGKKLSRQQYAEGWMELEEKAAELGFDPSTGARLTDPP